MQQQQQEWGGRKVFSGPCGDPPDVAQTPTFLTSNCGLTCSDRWWTCPQSTPPYTAMQKVQSYSKYDANAHLKPPSAAPHQHRRAFRLRFKVIACTGPCSIQLSPDSCFWCLAVLEKWYCSDDEWVQKIRIKVSKSISRNYFCAIFKEGFAGTNVDISWPAVLNKFGVWKLLVWRALIMKEELHKTRYWCNQMYIEQCIRPSEKYKKYNKNYKEIHSQKVDTSAIKCTV